MTHLTHEQIEHALDEPDALPHARECPRCSTHLADAQAVRARLKSAADALPVPDGLHRRVQAALANHRAATLAPATKTPSAIFRFRRWVQPSLAAAAALLIVAIPLSVYFSATPQAGAAGTELVAIHEANMVPSGANPIVSAEPAQLAEFFRNQLGFVPAVPKMGQGMSVKRCGLGKFKGDMVGSYVVATPVGCVSIIVVKTHPQNMGLQPAQFCTGLDLWEGSIGKNNLAAAKLGDLWYCAVGQVPQKTLDDLLRLLI